MTDSRPSQRKVHPFVAFLQCSIGSAIIVALIVSAALAMTSTQHRSTARGCSISSVSEGVLHSSCGTYLISESAFPLNVHDRYDISSRGWSIPILSIHPRVTQVTQR